MRSCTAVPGLTREDYHWHPTHHAGGGKTRGGDKDGDTYGDKDGDTYEDEDAGGVLCIAEVYFPLLAVVLPKWLNGFVTK